MENQQHQHRFVPMERREIRGIALSTIMMIMIPLFSIVGVYYNLSATADKNTSRISELEKENQILKTNLKTHEVLHSDCEKWRAVMEEKIKYISK